MEKTLSTSRATGGLRSVSNIVLLGALLGAGVVLKLVLGSFFTVMKPNFIIAMYCVALLLIDMRMHEAIIVGLLAGIVCQFFPGTPYINLISEPVGALAMYLLLKMPLRIKQLNMRPIIGTFISTLCSGFSYIGVLYLVLYAGLSVLATPLPLFLSIVFGTAFLNCIIVQALYLPLNAVIKKRRGRN